MGYLMYDTRQYCDRYTLSRAALTKSDTGVELRGTYASVATAQVCLVIDEKGDVSEKIQGVEIDHDLTIRVPCDHDIRPDGRGENADKITITTRNGSTVSDDYLVVYVLDHFGKHKEVLLKELP